MPLKIMTICGEKEGEKTYSDWITANPGIKILTKHVCQHGGLCTRLFIFYETSEDSQYSHARILIDQNAQFEMCRDIAKSIRNDQIYQKLTNKSQRQLYLLDNYNLPRDDADTVDTILQMFKAGTMRIEAGATHAPNGNP